MDLTTYMFVHCKDNCYHSLINVMALPINGFATINDITHRSFASGLHTRGIELEMCSYKGHSNAIWKEFFTK